jgi:hypothetical protein
MLPRILWSLACFLILSTSSLHGAEGWAQLKIGMTADEAAEALGNPLLKTAGSGFELWIYDNNAEAVFYGGPLVGWTTPSKGKTAGHAVDVWQRKPGGTESPVFILPRPSRQPKRVDRLTGDSTDKIYKLPFYRRRN